MLRPNEIVNFIKSQITTIDIDENEKSSLATYLAKEIFNFDSVDFILNDKLFSEEHIFSKTNDIIFRLNKNEPIQHILGYSYFYGRKFFSSKDALIPRPETEGLVDLAKKYLLKFQNPVVYDLCTGSGCIAITIANEVECGKVFALDICKNALNLAKKNLTLYPKNVEIAEKNIFEIEKLEYKPNLIVSNPPYVCFSEMSKIKKNVLDYEPHKALFVDDENCLIFYEQILSIALKSLQIGGMLIFEINEKYGKEVAKLLDRFGFSEVCILKDLYNKDRFVIGKNL